MYQVITVVFTDNVLGVVFYGHTLNVVFADQIQGVVFFGYMIMWYFLVTCHMHHVLCTLVGCYMFYLLASTQLC